MKHIKEYISVNERISSIDDYIIEEGIKDKIKSLWKKIKKEKVPEKVWTEDDLLEYKDKEVTVEDAIEIGKIFMKVNNHRTRNSDFNVRSFAYGLLCWGWQEYNKKHISNYDSFGDSFADGGYLRANKANGYDYNEIGVGMDFLEPFHWGWRCAEKLKVKFASTDRPEVDLKRED
jgi:hypothetical protein